MTKHVTLTFGPKGGVKFDANGFTGGECKEVTRPIQEALGQVISDDDKPELYEDDEKEFADA